MQATRGANFVLAQLVEQCLRALEVLCIETLAEPAVDRGEKVVGFGAATPVAVEPSETDCGAQFPELGLLLLGYCQSSAIELLGGLGIPLLQHQLAFVPIQLRGEPTLPNSCSDLQGIVQQGQCLLNLAGDLAGLG